MQREDKRVSQIEHESGILLSRAKDLGKVKPAIKDSAGLRNVVSVLCQSKPLGVFNNNMMKSMVWEHESGSHIYNEL